MRRSGATRITGCGLGWGEEVQSPNPFDKLRAGSAANKATRVGHPKEKRKATKDRDGYHVVG
jgi:hypothetical protein